MTRCRRHEKPHIHAALSIILTIALTLQLEAQPAPATPRTVLLRRGQVLELSLLAPLDSSHAEVGDDVALRVVRPMVADGVVILPADSLVHGQITKVTRAGKNCKSGLVSWKLERVSTPGGKRVKVQFVPENLAQPNGMLVDHVALDTTAKKLGRATGTTGKVIALAPVVALFLPWFILLAISMSGDGACKDAMGDEQIVPAQTFFYIAISHNSKLLVP